MAEEGMDADVDRLSKQFPKWNIRQKRGLRIATRNDRGQVSATELRAGLALTLIEDAISVPLEEQLLEQAQVEARLP